MIGDGRISVVSLREPAGQMDCVGEGIVEDDHAAGLEQAVDEDQVDEHVVEKMAAINEGEVEMPLLHYQLRQQDFRCFFPDLDEFFETRVF